MSLPLGALILGATAPIVLPPIALPPTILAQTASPPPLPSSLETGSVLRIDGSGSLAATNLALKQKFEGKFSGSRVNVATMGTTPGLQALADGKVDLVAIGRPLTAAEKAKGLVAIPIKREKIAMLVSEDNPFKGSLTIHQFAKIFRGEITNWSQVGGEDAPIQLVDLPDVSDTRSSFPTYKLFQSAPFQAVATAKKLTEEDPSAIAKALDRNSLGYVTADQVVNLPGTRALLMHQTLPNDPRYPFSQPLAYVYEKGKLTPAAKAFLGLILTPEGQAAIEETSSPGANLVDAKEDVATAIASKPDPSADAAASPAPGKSPMNDASVAAVPNSAVNNPAAGAVASGNLASPPPVAGTANAIVDGGFPGWLWWLLPLVGAGLLWWALKGRKGTPEADLAGNLEGTTATPPAIAPEGLASNVPEATLPGGAALAGGLGAAAGAAAVGAGAMAALGLDNEPRNADLSALDLTDDDLPTPITALPTEGVAIAEALPRGGDATVDADGLDLGNAGLGALGLGVAGLGALGLGAAALGNRNDDVEAVIEEPVTPAMPEISPVAEVPSAIEPEIPMPAVTLPEEVPAEPAIEPVAKIIPIPAPVAEEVGILPPLAATGGELPEAMASLPSEEAGLDLPGLGLPDLGGVAALGALGAGAAGLAAMAAGTGAETPDAEIPAPEPIAYEPITQLPAVAHPPSELSSEIEDLAIPDAAMPGVMSEPVPTPSEVAPGNLLGTAAMLGGAMLTTGAAVSLAASNDEAQSTVEAAKFDVGQTDLTAEGLAIVDEGLPELPEGYQESRILLMPRDPQWGYAYWDAPNQEKERLRQQGGQQFALRLYDVTDIDVNSQKPHSLQQYSCEEMTRDWYLPIPVSERDYLAEIGYVTGAGEWLLLARSNVVRIPPVYPSDWYNDQYMTVDWDENLYGQLRINLGHPGTVGLESVHNQVFGLA
ncbi:MAG: DUF4912 domain-containing protein, partial [Synechococcales bacterium]|nr:DUF4912 domain-containing protein [Synechococcales bacterium]